MPGLNLSFKIEEAIENGLACIVCKGELIQGRARVGFRLRDSRQNVNKYGEQVIYHFMNTEVLCDAVCADKLSKSWETERAKEKIPEHLSKINRSIDKFKREIKATIESESKFTIKKKSNDSRRKGKN